LKLFAVLLALFAVAGCGPRAPKLPSDALDQAIGSSIGDPSTCVLIADRATGKTVYSYNAGFDCVRGLPACDRPGYLNAKQALAFATLPHGRKTSCNSVPDGSRTVGWAAGRVPSSKHDFIYSAVMEGQRALPGQEMASRLEDVFSNVGL
jgi:predicted small lipoprotein YifL